MSERIVHRAASIRADAAPSARCFKTPRPIDLKRATWTIIDKDVTCSRCRKVMGLPPRHHTFSEIERQRGREARNPKSLKAAQRKGGRRRAAQLKAAGVPPFYPDEAARGQRAGGAATARKGSDHYRRISSLGVAARRARKEQQR